MTAVVLRTTSRVNTYMSCAMHSPTVQTKWWLTKNAGNSYCVQHLAKNKSVLTTQLTLTEEQHQRLLALKWAQAHGVTIASPQNPVVVWVVVCVCVCMCVCVCVFVCVCVCVCVCDVKCARIHILTWMWWPTHQNILQTQFHSFTKNLFERNCQAALPTLPLQIPG